MTRNLRLAFRAIAMHWRGWLAITLLLPLAYYVFLLASMIARFGNWPNYMTFYNWPGNVYRVFASTPSLSDAVEIVQDEWLFEVGYMNMTYGHGISEWSLKLVPAKMLSIIALGGMIGAFWAISAKRRASGSCSVSGSSLASAGAGSGLIALTGATMSWVVCCATPSWIVGLAMLGMSVSLADAIEPIGPWLKASGFVMLLLALRLELRALSRLPQSPEAERTSPLRSNSVVSVIR